MQLKPTLLGTSRDLRTCLRAFRARQDGNVLILFALLSLPLIGAAGAAIDYGLATRLETKLQAATDATALALCQTPGATTTAQLQLQASAMMTGYMGATGLTVDPLTVTANPRQITLSTHVRSAVFFGKFTSVSTIVPAATARCATPLPRTFEIALVLDNTGSMANSSGGQSKLQAVQSAASSFVDYVYTNAAFSPSTRLSIVPFAASVAVDPVANRYATWIDQNGQSSYHWTNVLSPSSASFKSRFDIFTALQKAYSGWGWAGCLETLPYPLNVQDGKPGSSADSLYVPMFAPDEPGSGSTGQIQYSSSYVSVNSYIDDDPKGKCTPASSAPADLEGLACKYTSASNAQPTQYGGLGIPNGPNFGCTTQPLLRLTNDTSALKSLIGKMAPLGSTNIHEGLMWGWRTLSPTSVFGDGAAYSSTDINKIIILMTDGANSWSVSSALYNQSAYLSLGYLKNANGTTVNPRLPAGSQNVSGANSARNALDALTAEACTNAKAAGISIYTIGFSVPSDPIDSQGLGLLSNCASSSGQAFVANNSSSVIAAFDQIAKSIGSLRLTQ